jgi:PKD repeat protein
MRTFNKIILFGMVLVSLIFAFSNISCLTDTYASIGDTKKVDANVTTALWVPDNDLVEHQNLKFLESGEKLNETISVIKEKSKAEITGKKPMDRKSLNNGSSLNSSSSYSVAGNDIVNLTALNLTLSNISDTGSPNSATVSEQTTSIFPVANFTSNVTKGYVPLSIQFIDFSQNVIEWDWDFGDGVNSTLSSPTHTYSSAGNYTICLNASNSYGTHSKFMVINVLENIVSPVTNSSINVTNCYTPISMQFTDLPKDTTQCSCDSENKTISDSFKEDSAYMSAIPINSTIDLPEIKDRNLSKNSTPTHSLTKNNTIDQTASNSSSEPFSNSKHTKVLKNNHSEKTALTSINSSVNSIPHYAPLSVEFTNISKNKTEWKQDSREGDNSTHTYFEAENDTVDLIETNATDQNAKTSEIYKDEIPKIPKRRNFKWK